MKIMKLALLTRPNEPTSLDIYRNSIISELSLLGVEIIEFSESQPIPLDCDLLFEPGLCMRPLPGILKECSIPIFATMHGIKAFSLPLSELTENISEQQELANLKQTLIEQWFWFRDKVSAVISVSKYSAEEVAKAFNLPNEKVYAIYNGIDHNTFNMEVSKHFNNKPYILHVSYDNPIKNIDKLFYAYSLLPENNRPDLIAVLPKYVKKNDIKGIIIIRNKLSQKKLAEYYRGAICFILPSLRETFGMPILESMACGCPVITSNVTGCAEIAGNAAHVIDPRSINEIEQALRLLTSDVSLQRQLSSMGLLNAKNFSWKKSAENLLQVVNKLLYKESILLSKNK